MVEKQIHKQIDRLTDLRIRQNREMTWGQVNQKQRNRNCPPVSFVQAVIDIFNYCVA